ncbi:polysaccharide biosynthesis tyrosine autokinase [Rhizobium sp.]
MFDKKPGARKAFETDGAIVNIDYRSRNGLVTTQSSRASLRPLGSDEETMPPGVDIEKLISAARRQWRVVALCGAIFLVLGVAYLATAVPKYTSATSLIIDTGNQKLFDQLSAMSGIMDDEASVLSQVEILRSEKIAQTVATKLNLERDAQFRAGAGGPLQDLLQFARATVDFRNWFASSAPEAKVDVENAIVEQLTRNLTVQRVGRSYVLELTYTSPFPEIAAKVAGAYADAYLTDQLDSKYDATRRASDWLQLRIAELRQKSLETDMAVQKFKAEKGLITSGGQLVTEQQLTQLNTQLIVAQADAASSMAKYKRIQNIIDSGQMDGAVTEALSSTVITDLQQKFLEASRKEADISSRLGANHVQAVRLRTEMSEYKRLMFEELSRIAETYKSTYEVTLGRQKNLEDRVAQATGISASANDNQVQLRELEREAETYKNLYQTFLQRYQEAIQQQSFPVTEARIISQAKVEEKPSSPKEIPALVLSLLVGLGFGCAIGAFREVRDRFFRTGDQIRDELDLEFIGTIPLSESRNVKLNKASRAALNSRVVFKSNSIVGYVLDHPLSSFAEALRSAKIAADVFVGPKKPKLIGLVSALPGEGKSTVSINFGELLASQGARVLLIDADLRNPGATRQLAQHATVGVIEVLQGNALVTDALMIDETTKMAFLPAIVKQRIPYSSDLIASEAMDRLIQDVSDRFDYIIFDLPPLAPVVDARAIAPRLDACLLVVEWGKTSRAMVRHCLQANGSVAEKCAGVILNKVNTRTMKLYQAYGGSDYYSSRYSSYYRT